jgi:hypothetical protein
MSGLFRLQASREPITYRSFPILILSACLAALQTSQARSPMPLERLARRGLWLNGKFTALGS